MINKLINVVFLLLALIFLILGLIGLSLPVIPQVPFFALAIFFAVNGSKRFKNWLKKSKIYQKHILPLVKQYKILCNLFEEEWTGKSK